MTAEAASPAPAEQVEAAAAHHACANCGTALQGAYCHGCGQKGHLHTRLHHLLEEFVEGFAHFDGRIWRTLPLLVFRPGKLSREWREGRRVRYVPPLHLFLFAAFLLFMTASVTDRNLIGEQLVEGIFGELTGAKAKDPALVAYKLETWAYKLILLIVPIGMLFLAVVTAFKRGLTLYDHAVVTLYGTGFFILLLVMTVVGPVFRAGDVTEGVAGIAAPVHAIVHLKGAYSLSWPGAIFRGMLLGIFSLLAFVIFAGIVVLVGTNA